MRIRCDKIKIVTKVNPLTKQPSSIVYKRRFGFWRAIASAMTLQAAITYVRERKGKAI